jgi:hypothetical protein
VAGDGTGERRRDPECRRAPLPGDAERVLLQPGCEAVALERSATQSLAFRMAGVPESRGPIRSVRCWSVSMTCEDAVSVAWAMSAPAPALSTAVCARSAGTLARGTRMAKAGSRSGSLGMRAGSIGLRETTLRVAGRRRFPGGRAQVILGFQPRRYRLPVLPPEEQVSWPRTP